MGNNAKIELIFVKILFVNMGTVSINQTPSKFQLLNS